MATMVVDLLCTLGFFGGIVYLAFRRMGRFRTNYNAMLQSVAEHFGFGFNPNHAWNGTVMSGTLNGYRCRIWFETVRRRSRRNRSATYLHATITLNAPQQLGLAISPQGVLYEGFQLPDRLTGNQDIVVGQEAFDSMYRVKGFDEAAVRAHLTPPRVLAILQTQQSLGTLERLLITDTEVSVRFPGVMSDMQAVSNSTSALVWLAGQLES
ncbi:MAG: hypothetical protein VXX90_01865 [Candidatus Thermoplasmatota archaeon]|nr:hypothetical protein [Candidatus Thermoplasmatota archaeon]